MYKEDLALNTLQWLICHKTQPNQTKPKISSDIYRTASDFKLITWSQRSSSRQHLIPCLKGTELILLICARSASEGECRGYQAFFVNGYALISNHTCPLHNKMILYPIRLGGKLDKSLRRQLFIASLRFWVHVFCSLRGHVQIPESFLVLFHQRSLRLGILADFSDCCFLCLVSILPQVSIPSFLRLHPIVFDSTLYTPPEKNSKNNYTKM